VCFAKTLRALRLKRTFSTTPKINKAENNWFIDKVTCYTMQYSNPYIEICLEGSASVFKGLSPAEKELIDQHHHYVVYKKGDLAIKEGDKARGVICLVSGKLKIFRVGVGGREQILKMVRPYGLIGYRVLFSESFQIVSVMAIEDSAICILDKNTLIKILRNNAEMSFKLMKAITEDLTFAYNRTVSLSQKHIRGRIAESLLILRDTYGLEADGKTLRVLLSREDIAHLSNMTTSNAIRTLSSMASEGLIELEGRKISIPDMSVIERISEAC
jgi:CRP-like cAMP-binding protein